MRKLQVMIVDDLAVIRRLLADALTADLSINVIGIASTGRIAIAKVNHLRPDVIILNPEMPSADVQRTLTELREANPKLTVILFNGQKAPGIVVGSRELPSGASGETEKTIQIVNLQTALQSIRAELIPKIKATCGHATPCSLASRTGAETGRAHTRLVSPAEIVAIGVSTGGPNALAAILRELPADFPLPIVVVQHMPPLFTGYLAQTLDAVSPLTVREAQQGELIGPGGVWIAPGNFHMALERSGTGMTVLLHQAPPENSCRPAADVLFRSVADVYGPASLAVVLTGMGQDGLRGCQAIRQVGGSIIVQDQATSVVWGMPRAVAAMGLADQILSLDHIAGELNRLSAIGNSRLTTNIACPITS
jgi:two-component system, chemotaxis family, protein-glutamate methylesterase/glutaminase